MFSFTQTPLFIWWWLVPRFNISVLTRGLSSLKNSETHLYDRIQLSPVRGQTLFDINKTVYLIETSLYIYKDFFLSFILLVSYDSLVVSLSQ